MTSSPDAVYSLRKVAWSVAALLAVVIAFTGVVDRSSEAIAADSLKRALVTFAAARALNGAISVAQGTELALEPAGVGVVLSVGQVLDPINDLVERFSSVMLVAASSIGLQNILLRISSTTGFDIALVVVALWLLLATWSPWLQVSMPWARRALLVAIFVRFALPVLIVGGDLVFEGFLATEQQAALEALRGVQADIVDISDEAPVPLAEGTTLLERFSGLVDETLAAVDPRDKLRQLSNRVADASEHIISLIVIFILQTVLLPIAFVWLFVELLKGVGSRLAGRV
jgi:hypothetical protein